MDRETFESEMQLAEAKILIGDSPNYWRGYQKGLMRQYHGEAVVSTDEHVEWLTFLDEPSTRKKGEGYWDGLLA